MIDAKFRNPILCVPENRQGRDFFVGDIHGEKDLLFALLEKSGFDRTSDRVFSVGDLIDRGPDSFACLKLAREPWFFPCLGNHEWMLLTCGENQSLLETTWLPNGGHWWTTISYQEKLEATSIIMEHMSLAIEVLSKGKKLGVIHGNIPEGYNWDRVKTLLVEDEVFFNSCIWGRQRVEQRIKTHIDGIDAVVFGHTPLDKVLKLGNCLFIDTGACYATSSVVSHPALTLVRWENGYWHCSQLKKESNDFRQGKLTFPIPS